MEQLLQLLMDALGLSKGHRWQDPALLVAVVTVRLLRPKMSEWVAERRRDKWPAAQATATSTRVLSSKQDWAVSYYYFVGSQRYGGYRTFHARNVEQAQEAARWLKGKGFMVRYNPAKPQQSAVLTADNPGMSTIKA